MNTILTALLCAASLINVHADAPVSALESISQPMSPKSVRVLLEKDAAETLLEVTGPYHIFNPDEGSRITSGLLGKRFMIRELPTGLKWGEEYPGIHQICIKPRSSETSIFVNGIQYSGSIIVYGVAGNIHVVNELPIEDYVRAILSLQFSSPLESEVFAALAILARTDAYYRAMSSTNSFWHVAAADVGYEGCALIVPDSLIDKAVETTKHLILVHSTNGKDAPFATAWTSHSGGKTASYQTLFRQAACSLPHGVEAPHAALTRQEFKWSYTISKKALSTLLDTAPIKSLELFVDRDSNKVYGLRVSDTNTTHDLDFLNLQRILGEKHLQSSDFTISIKDDNVTFSGFGKGHGVGLCLYSASALAQNGVNAIKILTKFFPETYLYNLNARIDSE